MSKSQKLVVIRNLIKKGEVLSAEFIAEQWNIKQSEVQKIIVQEKKTEIKRVY